MEAAARILNLKSHLCGSSRRNIVRLSAAADIEGHKFVFFCLFFFFWLREGARG